MSSNPAGQITITPSMLKRFDVRIKVTAQDIVVRKNWRVWLGLRLIWLGALVAGLGYQREDE